MAKLRKMLGKADDAEIVTLMRQIVRKTGICRLRRQLIRQTFV